MLKSKSFKISKNLVWQAYKDVKAKGGSAGIDNVSIETFEKDLKNNLYKIWNRLSSGSYFPPNVKSVSIPKKSGGNRILGIPTVSDRIAQTVVKLTLEPMIEPIFDKDSYGFRPNKSAHDAIGVTRKRCWHYDWIVEFDIIGLFDNIRHDLLLVALKRHCKNPWILLYIERWLLAPLQKGDSIIKRDKGTPQGGVVSPLLANLFLHYVFDLWIKRKYPHVPFCRYADDGLLHCRSKQQADFIMKVLTARLVQCGLAIHPEKSRVVYCKDKNRNEKVKEVCFDFLGYTFRPRRCVDNKGTIHPNFLPAVSRQSLKAINRRIRSWHVQLKNDKSLIDLSRMFNPVLRGWLNYYGKFYPSAMNVIWRNFDCYLVQYIRRKYKRFAKHKRQARKYLNRIARANPNMFVHWKLGVFPSGGIVGAV